MSVCEPVPEPTAAAASVSALTDAALSKLQQESEILDPNPDGGGSSKLVTAVAAVGRDLKGKAAAAAQALVEIGTSAVAALTPSKA